MTCAGLPSTRPNLRRASPLLLLLIDKLILINLNHNRTSFLLLLPLPQQLLLSLDQTFTFLRHKVISKLLHQVICVHRDYLLLILFILWSQLRDIKSNTRAHHLLLMMVGNCILILSQPSQNILILQLNPILTSITRPLIGNLRVVSLLLLLLNMLTLRRILLPKTPQRNNNHQPIAHPQQNRTNYHTLQCQANYRCFLLLGG